jgi:hypothetical protein
MASTARLKALGCALPLHPNQQTAGHALFGKPNKPKQSRFYAGRANWCDGDTDRVSTVSAKLAAGAFRTWKGAEQINALATALGAYSALLSATEH